MQMCEYLNLPDVDIRCNTDSAHHTSALGSGPCMSSVIGQLYIWTLAPLTISTQYIIGLLNAASKRYFQRIKKKYFCQVDTYFSFERMEMPYNIQQTNGNYLAP